jgi:hypothetical protein
MKTKTSLIPEQPTEQLIQTVRGQRVILDTDLARAYGATTTRLNQQVKRNANRFPEDFAFQLTADEFAGLILQIAISKMADGETI